jgi:hypothetical protein
MFSVRFSIRCGRRGLDKTHWEMEGKFLTSHSEDAHVKQAFSPCDVGYHHLRYSRISAYPDEFVLRII